LRARTERVAPALLPLLPSLVVVLLGGIMRRQRLTTHATDALLVGLLT